MTIPLPCWTQRAEFVFAECSAIATVEMKDRLFMSQIALRYSDGSFSVYPEGWEANELKYVHEERAEADRNERDPENLTKIVMVDVAIKEIVFDPCDLPVIQDDDVVLSSDDAKALIAALAQLPKTARSGVRDCLEKLNRRVMSGMSEDTDVLTGPVVIQKRGAQ